jgi:dienelactone hydrolase
MCPVISRRRFRGLRQGRREITGHIDLAPYYTAVVRRVLSIALMVLPACSVPADESSGIDLEPRAVTFPSADGGVVSGDLYGVGTHGLVLAHGGRFDKSSWAREARDFSGAGLLVLAIDFRGYGASKGPAPSDDPYAGLEHDVLGAVDFLRAQGARRVSVIGGSMGGTAAARALALDGGATIDDVVLLAHGPIDAGERLVGRKLFVVARDDAYGSGNLRLPGIRAEFERAPQPKQWLELEGSEHAQALLAGEQGDALRAAILAFLTAP